MEEFKSLSNILNKSNSGYRKPIVHKKSIELVLLTYKITKFFPKEEQYVLVPQIRRSVISIAANIVEGYSKSSKKEFVRFLDISIGSASELELYFDISLELKYFAKMEFERVNNLLTEVKKLLYSYQKSLRAK